MNEQRIESIELFPVLNARLMEILSGMSRDDWDAKTNFPSWTVKDICAHLLDTSIRRLSSERDGYRPGETVAVDSYDGLVRYLTGLADRWASAFSGTSPRILTDMIGRYQDELYEYLRTKDPFGYAMFPVGWAGEERSYNWFDIAREYTERWHHQAQIREALHREPLYDRSLYYPVLDTFMQALPYHYKDFRKDGAHILAVEILGTAGGTWFVEWMDERIELKYKIGKDPDTVVRIRQEDAWRLFTKWGRPGLEENVAIVGDTGIGKHLLGMTCIMM
ncbi:MAG: hypothetical protein CVV47_14405 [Spirochaetae bacterium HGW-Spirochaetae-3]|jgi:uncharacterized protein (TIGR03083 family)|nr:MAG: hypothetical protein CVV47_14405 [Spirochaetae bacterium HGW-Spirochaetae-3]